MTTTDGLATAERLLQQGAECRTEGDAAAATAAFHDALQLAADLGGTTAMGLCAAGLVGIGGAAADAGRYDLAARLFGAAEAMRQGLGISIPGHLDAAYHRDVDETRLHLGADRVAEGWSEGRRLTPHEAVALALDAGRSGTSAVGARSGLEEIELGERAARALDAIGEQREVTIAGIRITGRRRRPTGERAPLPRQLRASGWFWLVASISIAGIWVSIFAWEWTAEWWTDRDLTVLEWVVDLRNQTFDTVARAVHALGSDWAIRPLRWATILALVAFKRWRHLFFGLAAILLVETIASGLTTGIGRPRPFVEIIGSWEGYAHPAVPVARLAITLTFAGYGLFPRGPWRVRWFVFGGLDVSALVAARVYLGVDHPTDGIVAALFGVAIGVLVFRLFVPDEAFPVSYRRGSTAHLDVGGSRGRAIRQAVRDQLGFQVLSVEPVGWEGSGGSTPLRITVAGDPPRPLFAKLYASSHLRADRWYKTGRTILYGSLEDEVRFTSVRRLVEYEDYVLLLMRNAGLPSPEPYGIVEITPEREYLIVTEFLEGATELGDAEVDDAVIDDALQVVRRMWDTGLAHRDIKPANVMVRDSKVALIDVAFATVRPSPWRQAVDLANMMMILALRTSPERVYDRALRLFAPDDIAEAFAATRGITIPSQSRSAISRHRRDAGVDLIARFRELAPPRDPIAIQRWSLRRIGLTAGAAMVGLFTFGIVVENLTGGGFL